MVIGREASCSDGWSGPEAMPALRLLMDDKVNGLAPCQAHRVTYNSILEKIQLPNRRLNYMNLLGGLVQALRLTASGNEIVFTYLDIGFLRYDTRVNRNIHIPLNFNRFPRIK